MIKELLTAALVGKPKEEVMELLQEVEIDTKAKDILGRSAEQYLGEPYRSEQRAFEEITTLISNIVQRNFLHILRKDLAMKINDMFDKPRVTEYDRERFQREGTAPPAWKIVDDIDRDELQDDSYSIGGDEHWD